MSLSHPVTLPIKLLHLATQQRILKRQANLKRLNTNIQRQRDRLVVNNTFTKLNGLDGKSVFESLPVFWLHGMRDADR